MTGGNGAVDLVAGYSKVATLQVNRRSTFGRRGVVSWCSRTIDCVRARTSRFGEALRRLGRTCDPPGTDCRCPRSHRQSISTKSPSGEFAESGKLGGPEGERKRAPRRVFDVRTLK